MHGRKKERERLELKFPILAMIDRPSWKYWCKNPRWDNTEMTNTMSCCCALCR
jgi:hypothetical protein